MRPRSRDEFEIAIICALPVEANAVHALFDEFYDDHTYGQHQRDANSYTVGRIGWHNVVLAHMPGMGKVSAASVASRLSISFERIKLALVVGICGGVPFTSEQTQIILGDVIISHSIVEYDFGRQYPNGFRKKSDVRDTLPRMNQDIRTFISKLETDLIRQQVQEQAYQHLQTVPKKEWSYPGAEHDRLFEASYRHKHGQLGLPVQCICGSCTSGTDPVCDEALKSHCNALKCSGKLIQRPRLCTESPRPVIHVGAIGSADTVMKSGEHRDKIAEMDGVIGFEMEGAGVWDNLPCVIIKGVCDYADSHKDKTWQNYAAATAASCSKAFLRRWKPITTESSISESQHLHIADPLRNYYAASNRLHIQRLSGELLPMDQCYINLAVVESPSSDRENRPHGSSPFSLFARLNVETIDSDNCVSLSSLFEPQKQQDGTSLTPKRILIRGRAGVGKSTLCKKIVSDHLYHNMWQRVFNWVLWIPLRKLKRKSTTQYTFVNLFHDIYFSEYDEGKDLASSLWRTVNDPDNKNKTLFILDGLDEVSQEWDSETPMHNLLLCLLNQPQVIITSRPYGMNLGHLSPFDLELETIGFNTQEVTAYITSIVKNDTRKVDSIMSFIREHTLIQGLVRIPIQLDAMCYSWDSNFMSNEPMTMTKLYQAISLKLWQKDILRLGKLDLAKGMNEYDIRTLSASQIRTLVQDETNLLEGLAFIGLYNNIIEFNAIDRHWIYDSLGGALPAVPDRALKKISFLHTSDTTVMDQDRSYHFLHFTFQEFFAAQYFVKHWIQHQPILCVELRQRIPNLIRLKPQAFLRKEKYNSRYNILWRFVAGMLQGVLGGEPETEPLKRYFTELEAEPRDLLGPAHQRILMHCLNEVALDTKGGLDIRARTEEHLVLWLQFECNIHKTIFLGRERECPEHLLKTLLQEGSAAVKECVLEALNAREHMSREILEALVLLLEEEDLGSHAASALGGLSSLPQHILEALALFLQDEDPNMRFRAADALRKQSNLLQDIFKALVPLLKDEDSHIRSHAAFALGKQSTLSQEILEALVLLLKDEDLNIRCYAAFALAGQPSLPQETLEALVLLLKDKDPDIRLRAAEALRKQSSLLQDIFKALVPLLKDKDPDIRSNAALALGKQSSLPQEIVTHLVLLWKDEDSITVKFDIAEALSRRSGLPQEILESLMLLLKDEKWNIRFPATYTLAGQSGLSQEILEALVPLFKDEHSGVRYMAALAFSKQSSFLPQGILEALCLLMKHEKGSNVKTMVVNALGRQPNLPQRILEDLVLLLRIECETVSSRVEKALRNYNYLYSVLPSLDTQTWRSLYRIWLERSFREQVSCYLDDNVLYIDMPEGLRRVSFEKHKLEAFRAEIEAVQSDLNIPYRGTQRGRGGGPLHAHMKRVLRDHEYREPKKPRDGYTSKGRNQAA